MRSGIGYDSHRLAAGRRLILGGVEIEAAGRGLVGHSDADVATHAAIDALLGAAGLDDIGRHFPDTSPEYRDADSMRLLEQVRDLLTERGWRVAWVDVTVICEAPRLGPYRQPMQDRLGQILGGVNVKFTTNEGMGAIGRGEGIAAIAVATIEARA